MTNRRLFLLELIAAVIVTVPMALTLGPALDATAWQPAVRVGVVVALALSLAMLIDFTAVLLRGGSRRAVRA